MSFNELIMEIATIRNSVNTVEVRGMQNMRIMSDIYERCENIIKNLQEVAEQIQNGNSGEGEVNAESDIGTSG